MGEFMHDQIRSAALPVLLGSAVLLTASCDNGPPHATRDQQVGYRTGTEVDDYRSNGERGNVLITEINWAGSVAVDSEGRRHYDPDDIFIELQNKHPRPIHLTDWQLIVESGTGRPGEAEARSRRQRPRRTYIIPDREDVGEPIQPNEYVVIAAKRGGAFRNADYYIEDLTLPRDYFQIVLRDLDDRLIEPAGSAEEEVFAGSWDLQRVRSMERIQLIFSNRGSRESSWHTYSLNPWDELHPEMLQNIHESYREFTFASPGRANSPDYSGNTSSGDFQ